MSSFNAPEDGPQRSAAAKRAAKPRDAATLLLIREQKGRPHVLMGQRSGGTSFMPHKVVFPGGRLDRGDHGIAPHKPLPQHTVQKLVQDPRGARSISESKAQALAMAALRETFEETGLAAGVMHDTPPVKTRSPGWATYLNAGVTPALDQLTYIARAITPPYRPKRYDARFFMAPADVIAADCHDALAGSGELLDLHWVALEEATKLDLPNITRMIVQIALDRMQLEDPFDPKHKVPFFYFVNGKPLQVEI